MVSLIDLYLRQADEIEQVLSNLFSIRRVLPTYPLDVGRTAVFLSGIALYWHDAWVHKDRSDRDFVPARAMVRMIGAIGVKRNRDVQFADLAVAWNLTVEVCTNLLLHESVSNPD